MRFRRQGQFLFWIASFVLLALTNPLGLRAQTQTRTLRGEVLDPSGSVVINASVVVATPQGNKLSATTNAQGIFEVKNLAPGKYAVQVTAKGFTAYEDDSVQVGTEQVTQLKISLEIEQQQVKVEVTGQETSLDVNPTANAGAIVISGKELEALPDDPDELQSDLSALAGPSAGPNGGQFYIDGFTAGQLPPKSAIREIRINQNPFSAEYDKVGYGRIEIFTKPGTDKWHGQFSVNANDSALNSKNPFFNRGHADTTYPSYYTTQYSGNIGGPLSKKASFLFTADIRDINSLSIVNAQIVNTTLPGFPIVPFSAAVPSPRKRYNIGPRVDYQLTKTNTLSLRYRYYRDNQDNDGIGGFSLPSAGYNLLTTEQTLQLSDTQTIGTNVVNETNFQYLRQGSNQLPLTTAVTIFIPGAFEGGGSNDGRVIDNTNRYELQNYTSVQHGNHFIKFGARLRGLTDSNTSTTGFNGEYQFPSIQAYQAALLTGVQTASQFTLTAGATATSAGNPFARVAQIDVAPYVEDDWRIRPNIMFSYGLRFESQNEISDHADWAPRFGLAWGLGSTHGGSTPKVVLRAGFGIFYDRFNSSDALLEDRLNGLLQALYVYTDPGFFPNVIPGTIVNPSVYQTPSRLHAPYVMQSAVSAERQVSKFANISVSYLNSRGWDQLLTNNVNIPIEGTYTYPFYSSPTAGIRPNTSFENIYEFQSEGIFRENQLFLQATVRAGARLTLFSNYTLTYSNGDTFSATNFPSNPLNLMQDYGRSPFDVRNRYFMGGTLGLPYGLRLSPFMIVSSGTPYNITLSQDLIGTAQFNQRPVLAIGATGPTIVSVPGVGTFNTVPTQNSTPIPVDYLTGPGLFTLNLRLTKTFGFGRETSGPRQQGGGNFGGGGGRGGRGGGGRGGSPFGGGPRGTANGGGADRRYNITLSVNARNVFNRVNVATPSGVLNPPSALLPEATASPFFATPNELAGGSFSSGTANRLIYLQASFSF